MKGFFWIKCPRETRMCFKTLFHLADPKKFGSFWLNSLITWSCFINIEYIYLLGYQGLWLAILMASDIRPL